MASPNRNAVCEALGFFGIGEAKPHRFSASQRSLLRRLLSTSALRRCGADGGELLYRAVPSAQEDSSYLCIEDNKRTAKAIS